MYEREREPKIEEEEDKIDSERRRVRCNFLGHKK